MTGTQVILTSYWITFDPWPPEIGRARLPIFPRECGVTAASLDEALDYVGRGFYEDEQLPPVASVAAGVEVAPGLWAPYAPAPGGDPGIWHPTPFYPERTVVARPVMPEGWPPAAEPQSLE
jgi:hypothetical protein